MENEIIRDEDREKAQEIKIGICACSAQPVYTCSIHEVIAQSLANCRAEVVRDIRAAIEAEKTDRDSWRNEGIDAAIRVVDSLRKRSRSEKL